MFVPKPTDIVAAIPATTPFVGPEALEREMGQSFELRLGANESLFGASPHAIEAMQAQAAIGHFYGDPEGYRLRSEIAARNECGIENVVLASGIDELLMLFCRAYVAPGDKVVTTRGSYPTFEYAVRSVGGELNYAEYGLSPVRVDVESLASLASETRARILYIANPDNPSGSWMETERILQLLGGIPEDTLVLLDEAYCDFTVTKDHFKRDNPNLVRLRTFSKGYGMAGIRIGYAICHQDHAAAINKIRMHFGVSSVAQAGALAAYKDTEHLQAVVRETLRLEKWARQQLQALGVAALPSSANFILVDLETKERAEACVLALRQKRVFVRKPPLPPLDHYIRVSISPQLVMEEFLRRFASVTSKL